MIERSGLTKTPPLKPAMAVSSASGSISIAMPRGGRPLVTANRTPFCLSDRTAVIARSVKILFSPTSVPSTSAMRSDRRCGFGRAAMRASRLERAPAWALSRDEGASDMASGPVGSIPDPSRRTALDPFFVDEVAMGA